MIDTEDISRIRLAKDPAPAILYANADSSWCFVIPCVGRAEEEEEEANINAQLLRKKEMVSTRCVRVQYVHNGPIVISMLESLGSEKIQLPIKAMLMCLIKFRKGRNSLCRR